MPNSAPQDGGRVKGTMLSPSLYSNIVEIPTTGVCPSQSTTTRAIVIRKSIIETRFDPAELKRLREIEAPVPDPVDPADADL